MARMKILVTHDGSEMADVAVPNARALTLAAGPQTEVTALCITTSRAHEGSEEAVEASRSLERIQRALAPLDVTAMVLAGTPGPVIVATAEQLACDLIVMSTSGHSGSKHFLGSVADYVARHSQHIPVMLCRPQPAGTEHFKHILLPLDGSTSNAEALDEAARLGSMTGAGIVLLRLIDSIEQMRTLTTPAGYALSSDLADDTTLEQLIAAERDSAQRDLDRAAARLRDGGLSDVAVVIGTGAPGERIVETAGELSCDVIVMSSQGHGKRGASRLLGSVADHVLQHVAHAVVVVVPSASASAQTGA
jgi:nucleotide-binding universal stress UspA family protein